MFVWGRECWRKSVKWFLFLLCFKGVLPLWMHSQSIEKTEHLQFLKEVCFREKVKSEQTGQGSRDSRRRGVTV